MSECESYPHLLAPSPPRTRRRLVFERPSHAAFFEIMARDGKRGSTCCKATIVLDGVEYRCQRVTHDQGTHDADTRHQADAAWVRW
jgi:hypothetical protein